jgi:hypothetical protein
VGLPDGVVDRVMKRIFREAVAGGWRKLPDEEMNTSPNINMLLMSKKIGRAYSTFGQ